MSIECPCQGIEAQIEVMQRQLIAREILQNPEPAKQIKTKRYIHTKTMIGE